MQAIYSNNYLKTNENGGIEDDRYITAPEEMAQGQREYESTNIPTVLSATTNRNHDFLCIPDPTLQFWDSAVTYRRPKMTLLPPKQEFVPVTSFIHTIQVERARHSFNSDDDMREKELLSKTPIWNRIIRLPETVLLIWVSRIP